MKAANLTEREQQIVTLAERVMGWKKHTRLCDTLFPNVVVYSPSRSEHGLTVWNDSSHINQLEGWDPFSSIADAWLLVEKLRERYTNVVLHGANGWGLSLGNINCEGDMDDPKVTEEWTNPINGATPCEAICAATLATLEAR